MRGRYSRKGQERGIRDEDGGRAFGRHGQPASPLAQPADGPAARDIGEVGHLASCRLVSDKGGNIQLVTEDQAVNPGEKPGQLQLVAVIGEIIEPFAARVGVLVPHLLRPRPGLSVDPETQGGTPVVTGTRVPYDA